MAVEHMGLHVTWVQMTDIDSYIAQRFHGVNIRHKSATYIHYMGTFVFGRELNYFA